MRLRIALWAAQLLLAVFFLLAGYWHGVLPVATLAKTARWATDVPPWLLHFIGAAECAGAIGIVLPAATRIAPWLTPLAAAGLTLLTAIAAMFHLSRGETHAMIMPVVVCAVAAFVAWGRFGPAQIAPR
jgi:hypothetical protein